MSKKLINEIKKLSGAKFVGINNYENSKGEIANHVLNLNVDIERAKKEDLKTLKNFSFSKLMKLSETHNIDLETACVALKELIVSSEKNLNGNNTTQSKAQSDAYESLGKGLRLHKETLTLYLTGFAHSKKIIKKGEYKEVNQHQKTIIKNEIKKTLKMSKFRNIAVKNAEKIQISGSTIQIL